MQVNAVHMLLALLRQQSQEPEWNLPPEAKLHSVEELLAATKSTNMRLAMLELLLREQHQGLRDTIETSYQLDAFGSEKKPFVKLASTTSDAINQNQHQSHGRAWIQNSAQTDTATLFREHFEIEEPVLNQNILFDGMALPFRPSREDIETALQSGFLEKTELALLIRYLDFNEPKNSFGENGPRTNVLYFLIGAIFVAVILLIFI